MTFQKSRQDHTGAVQGPDEISLKPIGVVRSPYRERHGTPRQATVTRGSLEERAQTARIVIDPARVPEAALEGLEGFDYIWVLSWMHLNQNWRPQVVPPRGPRVPRGVLATRAPHRPNPMALSALRLERREGLELVVCGIDLLDGTPVLDVKPYVPYADAFPGASSGWLEELDEPPDAPDRPSAPRGGKEPRR